MKTLLPPLLFLLFSSCQGLFPAPAPTPPGEGPAPSPVVTGEVGKQFFVAFVRTLGDAALRTKGTDALKKKLPALVTMLDTDKDGQLSLAEVEAAGQLFLTDPEKAGAMLAALLLVQFPPK